MTAQRAILLVDHGSRVAAANELIGRIAEAVRARQPGSVVEAAHMEIAPPDIAAGIAACVAAGATEIDLHPYFLGEGRHTRESIPEFVEAALADHPGVEVRISEPLGFDPRIIDVVLSRIAALDTGSR